MSDVDTNDASRRADAAERTVAVLKKKVFELYNGGGSSLHKQLETAKKREGDNRRKRELSELRANELKRYSETLEAEVRRRTEAIKTILDNVTFGFLVVDRELTVQPESTRSCLRLFGAEVVEGAALPDLLGLAGRARQEYVLGGDQVFEDILPTEVSLSQMPSKFALATGATLQVEGSALRDAEGQVSHILFTISDMSALEAATRESNHNRALVGILRQKESFQGFVVEARQQLGAASAALAGGAADGPLLARHAIHTIKGNAASYGLDDLVDLVHAVEESDALKPTDVERIGDALRAFLEANHAVLGIGAEEATSGEGFQVSKDQMDGLRHILSGMRDGGELAKWTAHVLTKPAWQLLGPLEDFSQGLARRLGKTITFELVGGDAMVDVDTMRPLASVVPHLVRNAIDHGIEGPLHRGDKPLAGALRVEVTQSAAGVTLEIRDDGRGVRTDLLAARAAKLGLVPEASIDAMSAGARLDLVFVDGLSSAPVTTSVSGRGVGMSAVKAAAERVGGTVHVESAVDLGTTVRVFVPRATTAPLGSAAQEVAGS